MTEPPTNTGTNVRPTELSVTVVKLKNLRSQKSDVVNAIVRIEFGDQLLGESGTVKCGTDEPADVNCTVTKQVISDDPSCIDELASKPIICTITEVLPKEKKQKEEKSVIIGQCSIDLLPMLTGEFKMEITLPISAVPGSPLESLSPELPKPEIDLVLSAKEPLLPESQLQMGNIASITVASLYSPPETWASANAAGFMYVAAVPVPFTADRDNIAVFSGGTIRPGLDKEVPNRHRKWAFPGTAQGSAAFIDDKMIASDKIDEESGELRCSEDLEHRLTAEREKIRVTWNVERRCYLDECGVKSMRDKIARNRYWPVEIFRTASGAPGGKTIKKDDESISFHGVAYVDMSPLIYPGVQRITGAYKVLGYNEQELYDKTKRKSGIADEVARAAPGVAARNLSPNPKGVKKEEAKAPDKGKKTSTISRPSTSMGKTEPGVPDFEPAPVNPEDLQYNEAKSYIMIEICLHRPLVPRRDPYELSCRVADYIPPRPLFPKRTDCAEKAVEEYHGQIAHVANILLEEFREHFADCLTNGGGDFSQQCESFEDRRQKLVYHLNTSGKYLAFKEQLKYAVVKIVREKYLRATNFCDPNEMQAFLTELYVYLVDEMHVALNQVLCVEDLVPVPAPVSDLAQLKHFAREAEVNGNMELAARFYQQRIAWDKNDPYCWLDYGTFSLYICDLAKAEECFKECVAIDQRHLHGLLLCGVVNAMQEKNDAAETLFEAAVTFYPCCILAWTMFGLFYDGIGNEIGVEMAVGEANKLNVIAAVAAAKAAKEEEEALKAEQQAEDGLMSPPACEAAEQPPVAETTDAGAAVTDDNIGKGKELLDLEPLPPPEPVVVPAESIYMQIIDFLLDAKATPFTERALAHHLVDPLGGPSVRYYIALATLRMQTCKMDQAEESIRAAMELDYENPDVWAILGHIKYLTCDMECAKDCYQRTLNFVCDASETHSIYLRLASIYLQEGQYCHARDTFLMACRKSPSCVSWLGVGIACYRLNEFCEAEDALTEANILNNLDPEVWAYLCLVCLQTRRRVEAEQAYKFVTKLNLPDEELLNEIHCLQQSLGFGDPQL